MRSCVISRQQIIIGNSAKKTNLLFPIHNIIYIYILIAVMVSIILYAKLVVLCIITVVIIRWLLNSDDDIRVGTKNDCIDSNLAKSQNKTKYPLVN